MGLAYYGAAIEEEKGNPTVARQFREAIPCFENAIEAQKRAVSELTKLENCNKQLVNIQKDLSLCHDNLGSTHYQAAIQEKAGNPVIAGQYREAISPFKRSIATLLAAIVESNETGGGNKKLAQYQKWLSVCQSNLGNAYFERAAVQEKEGELDIAAQHSQVAQKILSCQQAVAERLIAIDESTTKFPRNVVRNTLMLVQLNTDILPIQIIRRESW